jgi:S2P endopeptidase
VHGVQLYHELHSSDYSLLPSSTRSSRTGWHSEIRWRRTEANVNPLSISISTTGLNSLNDYISGYLKKPGARSRLWAQSITRFYDLGAIAGGVGQTAAIILSAFTVFQLAQALYMSNSVNQAKVLAAISSPLERRLLSSIEGTSTSASAITLDTNSMLLQPIVSILYTLMPHCTHNNRQIPGVTVPTSHLWPILIALFVTQVIHEAGHYISAAL